MLKRLREGLGLVVARLRGVERHVELHSLRAARLREALELQLLEDVTQPERHLRALDDGGRRARVEVERERGRALNVLRERQRRVELEVREVGEPDERGQVVREREVDRPPAGGHRHGLYPVGPVGGRLLLVEVLLVDPVRVALEGERVVPEVRQQHRRDARVVVDHLALGEADLGIEHLVEVRKSEGLPVYLDLDRG